MIRVRWILVLVAMTWTAASAQSIGADSWWITMGGGAATPGDALTMTAGAVYGKVLESGMVSFRIIGATNDNPTVRRWSPTPKTYRLTDYGILYGPVWPHEHGYLSAGAGVGLVRTAIEVGNTSAVRSAASLPVEAQAFWQFSDFFGAGLYAFASINGAKSFSGFFLAVQLGVFTPAR